jgi:hypothetical protein
MANQVSAEPDSWRELLPLLEQCGAPMLPIGAGAERKGPVDPATGYGLGEWPKHPGFSASEIGSSYGPVIAAGIKTGGEARILVLDIDGATASEWIRGKGIEPDALQTWRINRDTDPARFKLVFRLTAAQEVEFPQTKLLLQTKQRDKEKGNKGEAVEVYFQPGAQVVVIGAHPSSGGNYFWQGSPAEIATPDAGVMALLQAIKSSVEELRGKGDTSSPPRVKGGGKGQWQGSSRRNPCPVCGRDHSAACTRSTAADGAEFASCYQGSTLQPPLNLKKGETHIGHDGREWAFVREYKTDEIGWKSIFKIHTPRPPRPAPEPPEGTPAQQAPWGQGNTAAEQPAGGQGGEEPQRESVLATFRELIQSAYMAVLADDLDSEMAAVAELKTRFRATDQQISRRMIEAHLAKRVKKAARQGDGVDLSAVQALTYRQDGFTIAGDVCLTYGSFGTGKTTYTVAKIIALCKGEGFLDRSAPCEPGKALFIATDSGAPALKKTLADLEIDPNTHPLFKGPEQRIWIWAHAPEQGHEAWVCDLRGLVKLEQFIEEKGIDLVVIDSAKSVSSGAGWQYTDNDAVKVLLRYMREAVAAPTGCSIEFISHDGTQAGSHSGAKAWAEDPSMVVALTPIRDAADESKVTAIRAEFKKDRAAAVDPRRFVRYRLTDGQLELVEGAEVVGNCADGVLQILSEAHARGHQSLTAKAIDEEAFALLKATSKTVRNTLVQLVNASRLVKPAYGRYALSPGEMQARGTPLRPSREESPQNTGQERANPHSRPDSRREGREGGELPEDSRRESAGKVRESSSSNGSKKILPDKRGLGTPPAAADRPHPLVELVEVPPPPSSAGLLPLLARAAAAPAAPAPDLRTGDQVELLQSDGSWRNGWRVADVVATSIGTRYRIECGADFRSVGPAEVRLCEQQEAA